MDYLLAIPRLTQRAGSFALVQVPEAMNSIAGRLFQSGSSIAAATSAQGTVNSTITNTSSLITKATAAILEPALQDAWKEATNEEVSSTLFLGVAQAIGRLKNFGGIFSYLTSRWALTTFTVVRIAQRNLTEAV